MFDVWYTPIGRADYNDLRADLKREVEDAVAALRRRGCAAAHYRLAGTETDVGRICVLHLARNWRVILGFPAPDEVTVLLVGRHLRGARADARGRAACLLLPREGAGIPVERSFRKSQGRDRA